MKRQFTLAAIALSLAALFFVGCADEDTNPTDVPPATPTNLDAHQTIRTQVSLSWHDVADEDSFIVQRSFDGTTWAGIGSTASDVLTTVDAGIHTNSEHWYRVASKNISGTSAFSAADSTWTWPRVFDFTTDQTDNFDAFCLDGGANYLEWGWEQATEALKLGVADPDVDQFEVALVSADTMPNQGWFEFRAKVPAWTGSTNHTEFEYYVERDPAQTWDVVGIKFTSDSTRLVYYTTAGMTVLATNPELPLMTADAWHAVRFRHYDSDRWTVDYDGTEKWDGQIDNVAEGSYRLFQEWQFNRGDDSNDQYVLIDDVANSSDFPPFMQGGERSPHRSTLDRMTRPVKK
jgi:hypothetical protein